MVEFHPDKQGILYVVSTPIGNLEDITLRALNVLKSVNIIICEDTRTSKKLLSRYEIKKRQGSYYSPKEVHQAKKYLCMIEEGMDIALVSESGTPCISDPGFEIVQEAYKRGVSVIPVPGPSAFIAALSASGIKSKNVFFAGFVPRKKEQRKKYLKQHIGHDYTFVFYDSKYRIKETIGYIVEIDPDLLICVAREMTKKFEEFIRGSAESVHRKISAQNNIKGEFTVICSPNHNHAQV